MNIAIRCKRTISTWRRIIVSWARLLMIFGEDGWYMVFFSFLFSPWGISPAKSTDFGHCSVVTAASHLFSWKGRGQFSSATPLIISYFGGSIALCYPNFQHIFWLLGCTIRKEIGAQCMGKNYVQKLQILNNRYKQKVSHPNCGTLQYDHHMLGLLS